MRGAHRVELTEIGKQYALLSLAHDLLLDLDFIEVEARYAKRLADAGGSHKGPRQAHAVEDAALGVAFENLVLAVKGATAQYDVAIGLVLQFEQHVQGTAHRSEFQRIRDEINHKRRGGATVEKYRITGLDQRGGEFADAAFFLDVAGVLLGHPVIAALIADAGDIATQQPQVIAEVVEIAAQGHLGNVQQCGHFLQVNGVLVLQGLLDKLQSLGFSTVHESSRA